MIENKTPIVNNVCIVVSVISFSIIERPAKDNPQNIYP